MTSTTDLIRKYDGLVRCKALRCLEAGAKFEQSVTFEDLYQAGMEGLIRAHRTYDTTLGVPLQAHIAIRVHLSIMREYTRYNQYSRGALHKRKNLLNDYAVLEQIYERPVSTEEMADFLALPAERMHAELHNLWNATAQVVSFDASKEARAYADDRDFAEISLHDKELKILAHKALECLSPLERHVIMALFFDGKPLSKAGFFEGRRLSKQGVSIIRDRALRKLREQLPEGTSLEDVW